MPLCLGSCTPSGLSGLSKSQTVTSDNFPVLIHLDLCQNTHPVATPPFWCGTVLCVFISILDPTICFCIYRKQLVGENASVPTNDSVWWRAKQNNLPWRETVLLDHCTQEKWDKWEKKVGWRCTKRQKSRFTFSMASAYLKISLIQRCLLS